MHSTVFVKMKTFPYEESVLQHNERNCFPSKPDHYLTILLEAIFIIFIMVMVVEGVRGVEGVGLDHGILCTFMGDEMRGQEQKSHHSRL